MMLTRSLDLIARRRAWMAPLAVAVAIAFLTVNEVTYQHARDGIASGDEMQARRVEVRRLQLLLQAAEAGQRGYMLTGQLEYKEPYEVAKAQLESPLTRLRSRYERWKLCRSEELWKGQRERQIRREHWTEEPDGC